MATNYPNSLDSLTNPTTTDPVNNPSHAVQHANANDAIEALQAKVGTNNSAVATSLDYRVRQLELNPVTSTANKIEQVVVNNTGSTLLEGQVVYASGSVGASGKLRVSLSSNAAESTSTKTFGILAEDIINGGEGLVVTEGIVEGINTVGANDGDPVFLGVNGEKLFGLANKPSAPAHLVFLGIVVRGGQANTGSIFVKIQNGFELDELHDVSIVNKQDNQVLRYNSTTGLWNNETIDNLFDPAGSAAAAQTAATSAASTALSTHNSATTNVHGIANTANLATTSYVDTAVNNLSNASDLEYVPQADVGNPDGVASLDATGNVPLTQLGNLVDGAPTALNTLNELAAALGDNPNYATDITTALGLKANLASPTFTGTPAAPTAAVGTDTTQIATTAFVIDQIDASVQPGALYQTTAPVNPEVGQIWIDSDDDIEAFDLTNKKTEIPASISANTNLVAGRRYFVTSASALTLTLPASPALNDEIQVIDASGNASTYNITIARNGKLINGTAGNLIIDNNGGWYSLVYTGTTYGWKVG